MSFREVAKKFTFREALFAIDAIERRKIADIRVQAALHDKPLNIPEKEERIEVKEIDPKTLEKYQKSLEARGGDVRINNKN